MQVLVKQQDAKLYNICFNDDVKLSKNLSIETNVDKFIGAGGPGANPKLKSISTVIQNSEFYLELSKFMNIKPEFDTDRVIEILTEIDFDAPFYTERKQQVQDQLKFVEHIFHGKLETCYIDDLIKINTFFQNHHYQFKFDLQQFNQLLLARLLQIITIDNLKTILQKFTKFKDDIMNKYKSNIQDLISQFNSQLENIDTSREKKLQLYDLDEDANYLKNIQYLSNGLIYPSYQEISNLITELTSLLKFIEIIDKQLYANFNSQRNRAIEQFSSHAAQTNNKLLEQYLSSLTTLK